MNLYDVIIKPILTEKAEGLRQENVYAFEVSRRANKKLVKEAIREIYGITPKKVNILNVPPRKKSNRYGVSYTAAKKKAYVFLDKKDKIDIFESV
ncbi:MAG: 50S ribosomal protein L23 [Candidatus Hydrogenedentota bacterium]|nr:MAG: 50S ribosomal protein L23 [Candidatus Hydrogenedentota bacterium]